MYWQLLDYITCWNTKPATLLRKLSKDSCGRCTHLRGWGCCCWLRLSSHRGHKLWQLFSSLITEGAKKSAEATFTDPTCKKAETRQRCSPGRCASRWSWSYAHLEQHRLQWKFCSTSTKQVFTYTYCCKCNEKCFYNLTRNYFTT